MMVKDGKGKRPSTRGRLVDRLACIYIYPTNNSLGTSVPARLGKGQGAKEIGRKLARERP